MVNYNQTPIMRKSFSQQSVNYNQNPLLPLKSFQQPFQQLSNYPNTNYNNDNNNDNKIIIFSVIFLLLASVGGGLAYYFINKEKDEVQEETVEACKDIGETCDSMNYYTCCSPGDVICFEGLCTVNSVPPDNDREYGDPNDPLCSELFNTFLPGLEYPENGISLCNLENKVPKDNGQLRYRGNSINSCCKVVDVDTPDVDTPDESILIREYSCLEWELNYPDLCKPYDLIFNTENADTQASISDYSSKCCKLGTCEEYMNTTNTYCPDGEGIPEEFYEYPGYNKEECCLELSCSSWGNLPNTRCPYGYIIDSTTATLDAFGEENCCVTEPQD